MKIGLTCRCGSSIWLETTRNLEKVEILTVVEAWQKRHHACLRPPDHAQVKKESDDDWRRRTTGGYR